MNFNIKLALLCCSVLAAFPALALQASAQAEDLREILSRPISVDRSQSISRAPIGIRMGKIVLNAQANGRSREFIFDTGSPTILSRSLVDELGLEIIGQNIGVDANGKQVQMDIAVLDSLLFAGIIFKNVPVLVMNFDEIDLGACIFNGGVIGSEIFPGSAWLIDTFNEELTVASSASDLSLDNVAVDGKLYDVGYPHAPIVDYAIGDVSDKALFDTGNGGELILYEQVAQSSHVRDNILQNSFRKGHGSDGVSAGGRGANRSLVQFELSGFKISDSSMPVLKTSTRVVPPTLIGGGILGRYRVVLDYTDGRFMLSEHEDVQEALPTLDYAMSVVGDIVEIVQMFEPSPAHEAGLRLGDEVIAIDGRAFDMTSEDAICATARRLAEPIGKTPPKQISVARNGRIVEINLAANE